MTLKTNRHFLGNFEIYRKNMAIIIILIVK
jgi:hypothetical protein